MFLRSFKTKVITEETFSLLLHQVELMLLAGMSFEAALRVLEETSSNKVVRRIAQKVLGNDDVRKLPKPYRTKLAVETIDLLRELLKSEAGDDATTIVHHIRKDMHQRSVIHKGVVSKLVYPVNQLVVLASVLGIMLTFVVPQFAQMFSEARADLPAITRFVMKLSWFIEQHELYLLVIVVSLFGFLMKGGGAILVSLLPFFDTIMKENSYAQFFGYYSSFLRMGNSLEEGWTKAISLLSNPYFSWRLSRRLQQEPYSIHIGKSFGDPVVGAIIEAGEKSETLPDTLSALAGHYGKSSQDQMKALLEILEPVLILMAGVCVGVVVVSLYIPLFDMADLVR